MSGKVWGTCNGQGKIALSYSRSGKKVCLIITKVFNAGSLHLTLSFCKL